MKKSNSIDDNNNNSNVTVCIYNSTHKNKLMSVNSSGKKHIKLMRRLLQFRNFAVRHVAML